MMWAVIAVDYHPRRADREAYYGADTVIATGTSVLIEAHSVRVNGQEVLRRMPDGNDPEPNVPHPWSSRSPSGWGYTLWTSFKIEEVDA